MLIETVNKLFFKYRLHKIKRRGLQIAGDCRILGSTNFGSEPYLISIGKRVTLSSHVQFITHDGGTWVFRKQPGFQDVIKYGTIQIHEDCFIGYGVILMPGIEIGPRSVVGAGAIVTKSVPPGSVAVGNPAKVVMTVEEYAKRCRDTSPEYDHARYRHDKRQELERILWR